MHQTILALAAFGLAITPALHRAVPNEAETLFREMEQKLTGAKTLIYSYEYQVDAGTDHASSTKGKLTLGTNNRMRLEASGKLKVSGNLDRLIDGLLVSN